MTLAVDEWQHYNKMTTEAHARYNEEVERYEQIQQLLDAIQAGYFELPDSTKETVLFIADLYAIMSIMTAVERVERAFPQAIDAETKAEYRDVYDEHTILFHDDKADYSYRNMVNVDYSVQREMIDNGEIDRVHQYKADNVNGLGTIKGAFSLAMLGFTEKMCIDTHVANYFGLDKREAQVDTVAEYERLCGSLRSKDPFLAQETSPYLFQWVVFDTDRDDGVTEHSRWFKTISEFVDIDVDVEV